MTALLFPNTPEYTDDGCPDLGIAACLSCPLPRCRHDMQPKAAGTLMREARLTELFNQGMTADEAATAMGISRRQVYRLKASIAERRRSAA